MRKLLAGLLIAALAVQFPAGTALAGENAGVQSLPGGGISIEIPEDQKGQTEETEIIRGQQTEEETQEEQPQNTPRQKSSEAADRTDPGASEPAAEQPQDAVKKEQTENAAAKKQETGQEQKAKEPEEVVDLKDLPAGWDPDDPQVGRAYDQLYGEPDADSSAIGTISLKSGITTKWGSSTYYHDENNVGGGEIRVGIDVSKYQGNINWTKVKAAGIQYAIIRAGYRGSSSSGSLNKDPYFDTNMKGAKAAGLEVGVYFFSQAKTTAEARKEAEYTLQLIRDGGYDPELPVFFDPEYVSESVSSGGGRLKKAELTKAEQTDVALAFCEAVEAGGYNAMLYTNQDWCANRLNPQTIADTYGLWLARYNYCAYDPATDAKKGYYGGKINLWQCTSSATVNGISGHVDLDYWYDGLAAPQVSQGARTATSVRVDWKKMPGASGYEVAYSDNRTNNYKVMTIEGGDTLNYTISGLTAGREYFAKVRAFIINEDGTREYGQYSSPKSMTTTQTSTVNYMTTAATPLRQYPGTEYKSLITVKKSIVFSVGIVTKDKSGNLWYKVSYSMSGKTYNGYLSSSAVKKYTSSVNMKKISLSPKLGKRATTSLRVDWKKQAGVGGYQIAYSLKKSSGFKVKTVWDGDAANGVISGLSSGREYYVKVRSFLRDGNGKVTYSPYSSVVTMYTTESIATKIKTTSSVYLRKYAGTENKALVKIPKSKTFRVKVIAKDKKGADWYKISYKKGKKTYTGYVKASTVKQYVSKVSGLKQSKAASKKITMKWTKLPEASGYVIYRATSKYGKYSKVKTITKGSTVTWTDSGRTNGKYYYYKIRAYKKIGSKKTYGSYSSVKAMKAKGTTAKKTAKKTTVKTTSRVNLRKKAGTSYAALKTVPKGKKFTVLGTAKDKSKRVWYKVKYTTGKKSYTGYISSQYAKKV